MIISPVRTVYNSFDRFKYDDVKPCRFKLGESHGKEYDPKCTQSL